MSGSLRSAELAKTKCEASPYPSLRGKILCFEKQKILTRQSKSKINSLIHLEIRNCLKIENYKLKIQYNVVKTLC